MSKTKEVTKEEVLDSILDKLSKVKLSASPFDGQTGHYINNVCEAVGIFVTLEEEELFKNILINDGFLEYVKNMPIINITPKGIDFINKGGYAHKKNLEEEAKLEAIRDKKFNRRETIITRYVSITAVIISFIALLIAIFK